MSKPEVIIDGTWLSALMPWGDLEWSTCWPGGTESITFSVARSHRLFRPDARVELDYGGIRLALGSMVEPVRGEPLLAEGLHRKAEDFAALSYAGEAILAVSGAVDAAIFRGMPWEDLPLYEDNNLLDPPTTSNAALDPDQVHSVAALIDASAQERATYWGIDPQTARAFMSNWETAKLHMLPGVGGLAISRDGYASTIKARYLDSGTSTYLTVTGHDAAAAARWGYVERTLNQPLGEGAAMTAARAQSLVDGLIAQGRSKIGWATPLEVEHGDVVTEHGQPVDLTTVAARQTVRLHGLVDDLADLAGQTWVDVPIGRTRHKDGVVTIEPRGLSQPMNDALAATVGA